MTKTHLKQLIPSFFQVGVLLGCTLTLLAAQRGPLVRCSSTLGTQSLFQVSTLDALSSGIYEGAYPVGQLKQKGNFGLGTYEGLDGEMIVLDGHYYHFQADGTMSEATGTEKVPFAAVTHFTPDFRFTISDASLADIGNSIDQLLPSRNWFYAIKIHGQFRSLSTRAIPKQSIPYPPIAEAVQQQVVFNHSEIPGTAVVLRYPAFEKGVNQVGYHYHFVSDDAQTGGHALDFTTGSVVVEVQVLRQNSVWLPDDPSFLKAVLPLTN